MDGGSEQTEQQAERSAAPGVKKRRPVLGIVAGIGLIIALTIGGIRWFDPFNPYREGTWHDATLTMGSPDCINSWGTDLGDDYRWVAEAAPRDWEPGPVEGRLHIIESWGSPAARFEARGTAIPLVGGLDDGKHFFTLACKIRG